MEEQKEEGVGAEEMERFLGYNFFYNQLTIYKHS